MKTELGFLFFIIGALLLIYGGLAKHDHALIAAVTLIVGAAILFMGEEK